MNFRMVFKTVGRLLQVEELLMLLPMMVSLYYKEKVEYAFFITIGLLVLTSLFMTVPKLKDKHVYAREGLVIVSHIFCQVQSPHLWMLFSKQFQVSAQQVQQS